MDDWVSAWEGYELRHFVALLFADVTVNGREWKNLLQYVHVDNLGDRDSVRAFADAMVGQNYLWKIRARDQHRLWISLDQFRTLLGQFRVTHYFDVHDPLRREQMRILINFIHEGKYELRRSGLGKDSGFGLFTLRNLDNFSSNALFEYGGRWMSDNAEDEGVPLRLENRYVIEPAETGDFDFLLKGWVLDGERFFQLKDLGRWVNHSSTQTNVKWVLRHDYPSLTEFIRAGMPMDYKLMEGVSVAAGSELFINYGDEGPHEPTPDYSTMANVSADPRDGAIVADHTIIPNEYIAMLGHDKHPHAQLGQKRKLSIQAKLAKLANSIEKV